MKKILPLHFILPVLLVLLSCKGKQDNNEQVPNSIDSAQNLDENDQKTDEKYILFFGNSLTAGYGLEDGQDYPTLIQQRLDSLNLNYKVINGGLSGETTSGGLNRIDWVLKNQQIDVFVLELGGNDILRGLELNATEENLRGILNKVVAVYPKAKIVLAGMQAPPNMGNEYTRKFAGIFPKLANEFNASLIPFFLEGVAANPNLNLQDGIHPNADGQKIVMENVWEIIASIL